MCDIFSWGIPIMNSVWDTQWKAIFGDNVPKAVFLDDEMARMLGERKPAFDIESCVGHHAIAEYYRVHLNSFSHMENMNHPPVEMIKSINEGKMDNLIKASTAFRQKPDRVWSFVPSGRSRSKNKFIPPDKVTLYGDLFNLACEIADKKGLKFERKSGYSRAWEINNYQLPRCIDNYICYLPTSRELAITMRNRQDEADCEFRIAADKYIMGLKIR